MSEEQESGATKLPRATLEQKIEVLDWFNSNGTKSQQYTVNYFQKVGKFSITKSSFNRWVKDESSLRSIYKSLNVNRRAIYKTRPSYKNFQLDKCLEKWYDQNTFQNHIVSEKMLSYQYKIFSALLGGEGSIDSDEKKSNGWVYYFKNKMITKKTLSIKFLDMISSMPNKLEDDKKRLRASLKRVRPQDLYQFDELILTPRIPFELNSNPNKFIVGLLVNSDSSDFPTPLIINDSKDLHDDNYFQSNTVMITNNIIVEFFQNWDRKLKREVVVMLDCLYEHVVDKSSFQNIKFVWFNPGFSTRLSVVDPMTRYSLMNEIEEIQPLNLGVIKLFKMLFKMTILQHYLNSLMNLHQLQTLSSAQIFQIIMDTYEEIKDNHKYYIIQCFVRSGILPWYDDANKRSFVDKDLESRFIKMVTQFEKYRLIDSHQLKISTIETILFPRDEMVINRVYTDSEIVALVKLEHGDRQGTPIPVPEIPVNTQINQKELQHIDKVITIDLKNYFQETPAMKQYFKKSLVQFNKFMNCFINESMDFQLDQEDEDQMCLNN